MIMNNLLCFVPEGFFFITSTIVLCASLFYAFTPNKSSVNFIYVQYIQLIIFTIILLLNNISNDYCIFFFSYESTKLIFFSKLLSSIIFFLATILIYEYKNLFKIYSYEFFFLFSLSFLGLLLLLSATDMLSFYLAVELYNLAIYCVIALRRNSNLVLEASIKYFIFGSLSSTFLLFSFSIFYALTGCINFVDLELFFYILGGAEEYCSLFYLGFFLFFTSIFIKIACPPYHFWAIDVYTGSPLIITLFISLLPKFVLVFVLFKLNLYIFSAYIINNNNYLLLVTILSLGIGLVGAIYQTKLKSVVIYSGIFNLSFFLIGVYLNNIFGLIYFFLFTFIYTINVFSFFAFLFCLTNWDGTRFFKSLSSLSDLITTQPYLIFLFSLSILSLMGLPPSAGFLAKLNYFFFFLDNNMIYIFLSFSCFTSLAYFYYLRLLRLSFLQRTRSYPLIKPISVSCTTILVLSSFINIFFFFFYDFVITTLNWVLFNNF